MDPKSGGQKWTLKVAAKSGPQKWRSKKDPKSGGEKWTKKMAATSESQKWLKLSKILSVLLSASVERFGVSRMQDFLQCHSSSETWSLLAYFEKNTEAVLHTFPKRWYMSSMVPAMLNLISTF